MSQGNICTICAFPKEEVEWDDKPYCSEFCFETTKEDKATYLTMKDGDFGFWPCSVCGCIIEDMYTPGGHCGDCRDKVEVRKLKALLVRCEPLIPSHYMDLLKEVQEAIK